MKHFPTQFDSIGDFKTKAKLILKSDAELYYDPPRKCSIHLKQNIEEELEKMEKCGVIRPVTEHTDWCSFLKYVKKTDGSLRICIDPYDSIKLWNVVQPKVQHLNNWIQHLHRQSSSPNLMQKPDIGQYIWMKLASC